MTFSVPMLAGSALQTAYSIVNALWVGNRLGTEALVAVTVTFPFLFVLMSVAGGLTLATTILVSQAFGSKDLDEVRRIIGNSVVLVGSVTITCIAIGHFTAGPVLRLMRTPADSLTLSIGYLELLLWTVPFTFGVFLLAAALRGVGDSKTPLYFQAVSVGMAAILDPLLMFGWLGCPKMGLNGTAVSNIIAQAAAFFALVFFLARRKHIASPDWRHLRADWDTSILTMKIGIPSMFQQALVSIGMMVLTGLVDVFGEQGAAAFGIGMRIGQIARMPALTLGMAVSALAGQNIGAKHFDRVRQIFRWGLVSGFGLTAIPSVLALTIPTLMMRAFVNDPAVIKIGAVYLRISAFTYMAFALMLIANGVVNGGGHTLETTIFTLLSLWGIRIPLAFYLSHATHRIEGIWFGILISALFGGLISLGYYLTGRWKVPVKRKMRPGATAGGGGGPAGPGGPGGVSSPDAPESADVTETASMTGNVVGAMEEVEAAEAAVPTDCPPGSGNCDELGACPDGDEGPDPAAGGPTDGGEPGAKAGEEGNPPPDHDQGPDADARETPGTLDSAAN